MVASGLQGTRGWGVGKEQVWAAHEAPRSEDWAMHHMSLSVGGSAGAAPRVLTTAPASSLPTCRWTTETVDSMAKGVPPVKNSQVSDPVQGCPKPTFFPVGVTVPEKKSQTHQVTKEGLLLSLQYSFPRQPHTPPSKASVRASVDDQDRDVGAGPAPRPCPASFSTSPWHRPRLGLQWTSRPQTADSLRLWEGLGGFRKSESSADWK